MPTPTIDLIRGVALFSRLDDRFLPDDVIVRHVLRPFAPDLGEYVFSEVPLVQSRGAGLPIDASVSRKELSTEFLDGSGRPAELLFLCGVCP